MIAATNPKDHELYEQHTGYTVGPDFRGIKYVENDEVLAVIGYDHWTPAAVQMHIWCGDMRAFKDKTLLRAAFEYPFEQAKKVVALAVTPADNVASLKFSDWMGFKEIGRVKDGWAVGVDMIVKEIRKDACPWLGAKNE